ncbi:MAG: HigA family addiction module antidote protein, partial [Spirochaetes bacterium]|nr:HigA family addiction module antidote protein [Spirochaetota bacterium]
MSNYNAPIAIHPGETLLEFLEGEAMTQVQLASRTGLTKKTINKIIKGKNPITHDTALKLSIIFNTSDTFWNNLQRSYDETITRLALDDKLSRELEIAKKFTCYKQLINYKYISGFKKIEEKAFALLKFLGISSFDFMEKNYHVAYRKAQTDNISKENLIAWLRCGEIEAEKNKEKLKSFNREKLISVIPKLRKLTIESPKDYPNKFVDLLSSCGVILVYVPYLTKTYVNGATRWLNSCNPLIQIAPRFKREDGLLFTIFHELGHILKHGKSIGYINLEESKRIVLSDASIKAEREADAFAQLTLINKRDWNKFLNKGIYTYQAIDEFAKKIEISSSIVSGRLAYELKDYSR